LKKHHRTYYLRDEERGEGYHRKIRVTLKQIENSRFYGYDDGISRRIHNIEDLRGWDCPNWYAEIDYTLMYKENGKFHIV
jgi:hypothetical protein